MLQPALLGEPAAGLVPLSADEPQEAAVAPLAGYANSNISTIPTAVPGRVSTVLNSTQ